MTELDGAAPFAGRLCAKEGCANVIPADAGPARKFCDDHKTYTAQTRKAQRARRHRDRPPASVTVNVGPGAPPKATKKDKRAQDTASGAEALFSLVAAGFAVAGDAECAGLWELHKTNLAARIGELSKYQPWLSAVFAPVGEESQFGAWVGVGIAALPLVLGMLAHHAKLPDALVARMGGIAVMAQTMETPDDNVTLDGSPITDVA